MKYSKEQYKTLSERFNKNSLTGKLILIKQSPTLLYLELDDWNIRLRLDDYEAMVEGLDELFEFPKFVTFDFLREVFKLIDINVKEFK
jgi:hypothetical protein